MGINAATSPLVLANSHGPSEAHEDKTTTILMAGRPGVSICRLMELPWCISCFGIRRGKKQFLASHFLCLYVAVSFFNILIKRIAHSEVTYCPSVFKLTFQWSQTKKRLSGYSGRQRSKVVAKGQILQQRTKGKPINFIQKLYIRRNNIHAICTHFTTSLIMFMLCCPIKTHDLINNILGYCGGYMC